MMEKMRNVFKGEKGFTLIELLVVVAIIGILVAIAIPQFSSYKQSANDAGAKSMLATVATTMEACYVATNTYLGCDATLATYGYVADPNITVTFPATGGSALSTTAWSAEARSLSGTPGAPGLFKWDTALGGAQF